MAEMPIPRLARLLGIVTQVEENGEASIDDLANHFGVSANTIRDDVDTLWVSGLPGYGTMDLLDFDLDAYEDGIIKLTESLGVRQVRLAPGEVVALLAALSSIVTSGTAPAAAEGALAALKDALHDSFGSVTTVIAKSPTTEGLSQALREGIDKKQAVVVTYVDAQDKKTERTIEPHRFVAIDGVGYVECFCMKAGDYRNLRLDRIETANLTDEKATSSPKELFDWIERDTKYEAEITVEMAGRWAFEDLPGVSITENPEDAHVIVTFGVVNQDVIVSRLLSVAPHLRSVKPDELKEQLKTSAKAVLEPSAR